jgi:LemA protein
MASPGLLGGGMRVALALALGLGLASCGAFNAIPALEERARSAWGEAQAQYRSRHELVPKLVDSVRRFAPQEQEVLAQVGDAQTRAERIQVGEGTVTDKASFREYQEAQSQLSAALGRLLATVERYPELKSNAGFVALLAQLEGTENRIAVARRDYSDAVRAYNRELRNFPGNWIAAVIYPDARPLEPFTTGPRSEAPAPKQL